MSKFNKGEWSELYVFFKLLGEGKLHIADINYNKIPNVFYSILAILRRDKGESYEYIRNGKITLIDQQNNEIIATLEIEDILEIAGKLYESIKKGVSTFEIDWITKLLEELKITELKSKSSQKQDIEVRIHDPRTNLITNLGFSIKSSLGSLSTLFNSGKTTNFLYEIFPPEGYNPEIVNELDSKPKYKTRFEKLEADGCKVVFRDVESVTFKQNLVMIDSLLPCLLGKVLYYYYAGKTKPSMISVIELLQKLNPLHFDLSENHPIYEHKIRTMLTDMALGMTSGTIWNGRYKAVGGFIIVKEDGDIICYHIYDKDEFQDFLLHHSKLDVPDSGRHEFGKVFKKDDRYFIRLNLQIRYNT